MSEAAFPLLGAAFVILLVLPAFSLLAAATLTLLERGGAGLLHKLHLRYFILIGATVVPIAWFLSAGVHQAESGTTALVCLFDHDASAVCFEPGFFALTLGLFVMALAIPAVLRPGRPQADTSDAAMRIVQRFNAVGRTAGLLHLAGKLKVTADSNFAIAAFGIRTPMIFIGRQFADQLSDAMLLAALHHEAEHLRAHDPLRFLALRLTQAINPLGRFLLAPHIARWQAAREAHCDREAVLDGANPLALADAIVVAARPPQLIAALAAANVRLLTFRVELLLAFAERAPVRCCHRGTSALPALLVVLIATLALPHQAGEAVLDALHAGAEHTIKFFVQ